MPKVKLNLTQKDDKVIFDNIISALREGDFVKFTNAIHAVPGGKRLGSELQLEILIEAAKYPGLFKEVYNVYYNRPDAGPAFFVKQNTTKESPLSVAVNSNNTELVKFMFEQAIAEKTLRPFRTLQQQSPVDDVIAAAYRAAVATANLELVKAFQPGVKCQGGNLYSTTTGQIICDRHSIPLGNRWSSYWQEICLSLEEGSVKTALTIAIDKAGDTKTEEALAVVTYLVEEVLGAEYYSSTELLTVLKRAGGYYGDSAVHEYLKSRYQPAIESRGVVGHDSSGYHTEVKDHCRQQYVASIAAGRGEDIRRTRIMD